MHTWIHKNSHTHIHKHIHTYTPTYINTMDTYMNTHVLIRRDNVTHIYIHIWIHIWIHTYWYAGTISTLVIPCGKGSWQPSNPSSKLHTSTHLYMHTYDVCIHTYICMYVCMHTCILVSRIIWILCHVSTYVCRSLREIYLWCAPCVHIFDVHMLIWYSYQLLHGKPHGLFCAKNMTMCTCMCILLTCMYVLIRTTAGTITLFLSCKETSEGLLKWLLQGQVPGHSHEQVDLRVEVTGRVMVLVMVMVTVTGNLLRYLSYRKAPPSGFPLSTWTVTSTCLELLYMKCRPRPNST
jgi:hypothetical protein